MDSKIKKIKLFCSDVDGVLTDASMYYFEGRIEGKKFNTRDGMGFQLLRENGIKTGIITSENTEIVSWRAEKLQVDYLYQGKGRKGKLDSVIEITKELKIDLKNVAYIGDDVNCLDILNSVGLKACPSDAVKSVKQVNDIIILQEKGGKGCVREFIDFIIENNLH